MSSTLTEYKNFHVVKTWENRVKLLSPVLAGEPERAYIFQILLNKRPEIKEMLLTVKSGEVDIRFAEALLPRENLLKAVDAILGNVAKKSSQIDKKKLPGNPKEINLRVGGMSCPACALLIEMALKKDEQIVDASADLESKLVRVYGSLSKKQVIDKIEKLGYKAIGDAS